MKRSMKIATINTKIFSFLSSGNWASKTRLRLVVHPRATSPSKERTVRVERVVMVVLVVCGYEKSVCSDHSWPPAHLSPSKSLSQTWIFRNCQMWEGSSRRCDSFPFPGRRSPHYRLVGIKSPHELLYATETSAGKVQIVHRERGRNQAAE